MWNANDIFVPKNCVLCDNKVIYVIKAINITLITLCLAFAKYNTYSKD